MMSRKKNELKRLVTGIPNFDALVSGGFPIGSVTVVGGAPGAGKSTLIQQICFHNAGADRPVLYFNTLSEPTAKTLLHLNQFDFFDAAKIDSKQMHFIDIGSVLRNKGLEHAANEIMRFVKELKPAIVVIDSFKAFDDWAQSRAELRKFVYELTVGFMAWQTTTFLLGEFGVEDMATNPLFSVVDGLVVMSQREQSGEQQRFLQIVKMRGTAHSRDEVSFEIADQGIDVFAPRLTIRREAAADQVPTPRMMTGISKLDELLGEGIPLGSSVLVCGAAGTGKTVMMLEFLYRGAMAGEKGILFSFEETVERLRSAARGLGWDFDRYVESGMIEIIFIPQPEIAVEKHLLLFQQRIKTLQARRVAMDSISVFLHKIRNPEASREKVFQIASVVQNSGAVGLLATDIPYGSNQVSRFGVEETVVDGVVLLSATEEGFERQRYLEVYKLRNTAHLKGRHNMVIGQDGIKIYPRYFAADLLTEPPPPLELGKRLSSGVASLDPLLGGGLIEKSVTLVSGSAGIGKSTLGIQFLLEGAKNAECGLFVALEEGPAQIIAAATALGLPLQRAIDEGLIDIIYLTRQSVRANQFLSVLADHIQHRGVRRLVLDGVGHIVSEGLFPEDLRQMLFALSSRFKSLGVTSLFTLESNSLHASDTVTEEGFSPVADNLVVLRYARAPDAMRPFVTVIKTRGSAHDNGIYPFSIAEGGAQVGPIPSAPSKRS